MLGDRRLGDAELRLDDRAHRARTLLPAGQQFQDSPPHGVAENVERLHRATISLDAYISQRWVNRVAARGAPATDSVDARTASAGAWWFDPTFAAKGVVMGLAWQQGPLASGAIGHFLVPEPLPSRLLFAEPLRRRMRVRLAGEWIVDSDDVVLLHEPGHYPVAYFPIAAIRGGVLRPTDRVTHHRDLGATAWFTTAVGDRTVERAAWQLTDLPDYADVLRDRIAFAWPSMDALYEEDERIVGHAADLYHRNDIRQTSRHLVVRDGDRVIADSTRPLALYESGFAPRWYVPRADVDESALMAVDGQTFCPYKGLASYYDIGEHARAAWSYRDAWPEVRRVADMVSFEPDKIDVYLDGKRIVLEPGQSVVAHGVDRGLDVDEIAGRHD
jgi:uncharacterized protein (DUF427 family)